jgi:copper resistance protein D
MAAVAWASGQTPPASAETAASSGGTPAIDPGVAWSIFNHRGAGWFILVWGVAALVVGLQWPRRTWLRFVPPLVLFGMVEFLFLRNDPEAWPTGPIGLWESLKDPEVLQHRIFLLLLLAIAVVELLRAADRLPVFLQRFAVPALAVTGGIYLFFHKHGGAGMEKMMADPSLASSPSMAGMMASMDLVKHEHLWFSLLGFGLAAAKLLADGGKLRGRAGAIAWTLFAIALGFYMTGYTE